MLPIAGLTRATISMTTTSCWRCRSCANSCCGRAYASQRCSTKFSRTKFSTDGLHQMGTHMPENDPLRISPGKRLQLYAARRFIPSSIEQKLGVEIPFDVYVQDPLFGKNNPKLEFDNRFVPWEPGIGDGPTRAKPLAEKGRMLRPGA